MRESALQESQHDGEATCCDCSALRVQIEEFTNIVKQQQQTINALDVKLSEVMSMLHKLQPNHNRTSTAYTAQAQTASTARPSNNPGQHLAWSGRNSRMSENTVVNSVRSLPWVQQDHHSTDPEIDGVAATVATDNANSHFTMIVHRTLNDMSRRKRNIVVSGLPEEDEYGNDDQTTFTEFCEAFLPIKPSLSDGN